MRLRPKRIRPPTVGTRRPWCLVSSRNVWKSLSVSRFFRSNSSEATLKSSASELNSGIGCSSKDSNRAERRISSMAAASACRFVEPIRTRATCFAPRSFKKWGRLALGWTTTTTSSMRRHGTTSISGIKIGLMRSAIRLAKRSSVASASATPRKYRLLSSTPITSVPPAVFAKATKVFKTFSGDDRSRLNSRVLSSVRFSNSKTRAPTASWIGWLCTLAFPFQRFPRYPGLWPVS